MKKILILAVWTVAVAMASQLRINDVGHIYNVNDSRDKEIQLCNATMEMLHQYYQYLDVELTENGDTIARHNFFWDVISESESYLVANEILEGNWGDFHEDWQYDNGREDYIAFKIEEHP